MASSGSGYRNADDDDEVPHPNRWVPPPPPPDLPVYEAPPPRSDVPKKQQKNAEGESQSLLQKGTGHSQGGYKDVREDLLRSHSSVPR